MFKFSFSCWNKFAFLRYYDHCVLLLTYAHDLSAQETVDF